MFSDFDFIVYVEDLFKIPDWLDQEPDGKPFVEDAMNLAYRSKKFIDNKYDVEIFFLRQSSLNSTEIQRKGESAGIPMSHNTNHKHIVVYKSQNK